MSDDQLRTDEDVEGILRLAVQQSLTSSEDLRSRLQSSAAELGISEEQLVRAEEEYFREKEEARIREAREAKEKEILAGRKKEQLWRVGMGVLGGLVAVAVIFLLSTGAHVSSFVAVLIPAFIFKYRRLNQR